MDDHQPIELDPIEVVRVENIRLAIERGTIELPGIGTAKIIDWGARVLESMPPQRTTTLVLELKHSA